MTIKSPFDKARFCYSLACERPCVANANIQKQQMLRKIWHHYLPLILDSESRWDNWNIKIPLQKGDWNANLRWAAIIVLPESKLGNK